MHHATYDPKWGLHRIQVLRSKVRFLDIVPTSTDEGGVLDGHEAEGRIDLVNQVAMSTGSAEIGRTV